MTRAFDSVVFETNGSGQECVESHLDFRPAWYERVQNAVLTDGQRCVGCTWNTQVVDLSSGRSVRFLECNLSNPRHCPGITTFLERRRADDLINGRGGLCLNPVPIKEPTHDHA